MNEINFLLWQFQVHFTYQLFFVLNSNPVFERYEVKTRAFGACLDPGGSQQATQQP
jgi:hypothetical protein